jgi:hypothetical protein
MLERAWGMLNPVKTLKAYTKRVGRLGKQETPVPWSENTVFLRRLWPDGTWQLPINTTAFTDSVTRVWDGKRWVDRQVTRKERIAKHYAELDTVARSIILDTHALEEETRTTASFPHLKGRLQGLQMTTIEHGWLPSHAAMKQVRERLNLDEKPIAYIADQLRAKGKLRP